jgi:protein TonB
MFELATVSRQGPRKARLVTVGLSIGAHVLAAATVVALSFGYAADSLPEPPDILAFVAETAPPPPPPPPPAPPSRAEEPRSAPSRPKRVRRQPTPPPRELQITKVPAAPVEAPAGIAPETGLEDVTTAELFEGAGIPGGVVGGVPGGLVGGVPGGIGATLPPPPQAPPEPIRVGGQITPPRLMRRVNPEYPLFAERAKIEGTVILEATVGTQGRVRDVRVLRSHPMLAPSAIEAVKQWRYEPLVLNGRPHPFVLTVTVSYHLS